VCTYLALTPLMLKLHPMRMAIGGFALLTVASFAAYVGIRGPLTFTIFIVVLLVSVAIYQGGTAAVNARMLPAEKYGQFTSAGSMIFRLGVAIGAWVLGLMLGSQIVANVTDWMRSNFHTSASKYQFIFFWLAAFNFVGLLLTILVYFDWKKLGGEHGYKPPMREPKPIPAESLPPACT